MNAIIWNCGFSSRLLALSLNFSLSVGLLMNLSNVWSGFVGKEMRINRNNTTQIPD